ncbi:MAG: 3-oxoacyl-[acyl-carrier protein] reductase [Parvicellaceae bacterium]|jgi:3-oxoacyl-[acyl-carrier protein] reductase
MKYALVTGASRGIGAAIAIRIAKDHGYKIIVNYNSNQAAAESTLATIQEAGGDGVIMQFNVAEKSEVDTAVEGFYEKNPEAVIEVLINNAGITKDNLFVFFEKEDWSSVLDVSLNGFFNVTSAIMKKMVRKRYGRVINIVSVSGVKGVPGQSNYSAAKGGVIGATRSLAAEVAKRKITVNAVAPGFIETEMTADLPKEELVKLVPANRFGTPEEVAHAVSFLASPEAAYITGEVLNINGGIHS